MKRRKMVTSDLTIRVQAAVLVDPYAKAIMGRRRFGELGPVRPPNKVF